MAKFQSGNSGNSVNEKRKDFVDTNSKSNQEGRPLRSQPENEPSNKRAKNFLPVDLEASNMSMSIGKTFFRTKLCPRFVAGTCRYATNCNFAHSMQELWKPPSNWQENVDVHNEEPSRDVNQIPVVGLSDRTTQGYNNRQYFQKNHKEEGSLYGDFTFLHDERNEGQTEAICLVAGSDYGQGSKGFKYNATVPKWKTKTCTNWEQTGNCAYGKNCNFAHGAAELHSYGGVTVDKASASTVGKSLSSVPKTSHTGAPSRKLPNVMHKTEIPARIWKGPNKISKIYGDWIDDL